MNDKNKRSTYTTNGSIDVSDEDKLAVLMGGLPRSVAKDIVNFMSSIPAHEIYRLLNDPAYNNDDDSYYEARIPGIGTLIVESTNDGYKYTISLDGKVRGMIESVIEDNIDPLYEYLGNKAIDIIKDRYKNQF